jgi:transposase-like protein
MRKCRPPYPPEFRQRIIELVRKGRTPESLPEQFKPSGQTIRNWLAQADRDTGSGRMASRPTSGRSSAGCGGRTRPSAKSGRSQKTEPRPGLPRRPADPLRRFEFVRAHRATHRLATLCRVLGVSPKPARPPRRPSGRPPAPPKPRQAFESAIRPAKQRPRDNWAIEDIRLPRASHVAFSLELETVGTPWRETPPWLVTCSCGWGGSACRPGRPSQSVSSVSSSERYACTQIEGTPRKLPLV